MELDYALLADFAEASPDGKVHILGAAIDTVFALSVPAPHHGISVVLRLIFFPSEANHAHKCRIVVVDSEGGVISNTGDLNFTPLIPPGHDEPRIGFVIAARVLGITFPRYGHYRFRIEGDGQVLKEIPFAVRRLEDSSPATQPEG